MNGQVLKTIKMAKDDWNGTFTEKSRLTYYECYDMKSIPIYIFSKLQALELRKLHRQQKHLKRVVFSGILYSLIDLHTANSCLEL